MVPRTTLRSKRYFRTYLSNPYVIHISHEALLCKDYIAKWLQVIYSKHVQQNRAHFDTHNMKNPVKPNAIVRRSMWRIYSRLWSKLQASNRPNQLLGTPGNESRRQLLLSKRKYQMCTKQVRNLPITCNVNRILGLSHRSRRITRKRLWSYGRYNRRKTSRYNSVGICQHILAPWEPCQEEQGRRLDKHSSGTLSTYSWRTRYTRGLLNNTKHSLQRCCD